MSLFIRPHWPAPTSVKAFVTTRRGGVSRARYESFNLADHVEDTPDHVLENRQQLQQALSLPTQPRWLKQTHSTHAVRAESVSPPPPEADAAYTQQTHVVCAVLTADCLPLLVCDQQGTTVAAIHAGWQGLLNGIIEQTLIHLPVPASALYVWIGPAITQAVYPVGDELRERFIAIDSQAEQAFTRGSTGQWHADLQTLAKLRLKNLGVLPSAVHVSDECTYSNPDRFYSARRDGLKTGRIASLIWLSTT